MASTTRARITYYAPDRTFVWLHKDQTFFEFRDALRRKLALSDDVIIYVKQIHAGNILDIDNEEEYEAFCDFARTAPTIDVQISVNAPNALSSSERKADKVQGLSRESSSTHSCTITAQPADPGPSSNKKRTDITPEPEHSISVHRVSERKRKRRRNAEHALGPTRFHSSDSIALCGDELNQTINKPGTVHESRVLENQTQNDVSKGVVNDSQVSKVPSVSNSVSKKKRKRQSKPQVECVLEDLISSTAQQEEVSHIPPSQSSPNPELSVPSPSDVLSKDSINFKKRKRADEELDDPVPSAKPKKRKRKARSAAKDTQLQAEPLHFLPQLILNGQGSASQADSEVLRDPPPLIEQGTVLSQSVQPDVRGGKRKVKHPKPSINSPIQSLQSSSASAADPTTSQVSVKTKTVSKPVKKPNAEVSNEKSSGSDRPLSAVAPSATERDTVEKTQKRITSKSAPHPSKSRNVAKVTLADKEMPFSSTTEEPLEPFDSSSRFTAKKRNDVDASRTTKDDTTTVDQAVSFPHMTQQIRPAGEPTGQVAIRETTVLTMDTEKNEARGKKKSKAITKPKRQSSPRPICDIQDIMNQVLAKNRITQSGSSASSLPRVPAPKPTVQGKKILQVPQTDVSDAVVPSSPVADSSPIRNSSGMKNSHGTETSESTSEPSCPVCTWAPFHLRYQCPIILGGSESIQKRINELKTARPILKPLIDELQVLLKKSIAKKARRESFTSTSGRSDTPSSESIPETVPECPAGAEDTLKGVPPPAVITEDSEDDSSNDSDHTFPKTALAMDSDDDLDALLRGPKQPNLQKSILSKINSEDGVDDEDEREHVEVEDDESEATKFRHLTKRYKYDGSSDEGGFVNDRQGSPPPDPPLDNRIPQVISHTNVSNLDSTLQERDELFKASGRDADAQTDDDIVPQTDDEMEEDGLTTQQRSLISSQFEQESVQTPTRLSKATRASSKSSSSEQSVSRHNRITELKATRSVLKYLTEQLPDIPDPIEPSDDGSVQSCRNNVGPSDPIEQDAQDEIVADQSPAIPIHSSPSLITRMKNRSGAIVGPSATPIVLPELASRREDTLVRAAGNAAPGSLTAMRPPPTPPWLSGEENVVPKKETRSQGSKKAQSTPVQDPSHHRGSQSKAPRLSAQSLTEWTALTQTQSPLAIMSESSMIDELRSSSGDDLFVKDTPTLTQAAAVPPRHRKASQAKGIPLFFPGTSQGVIPNSQLPGDEHEKASASASSSSSDAESGKKISVQLQRSRSFSSSAPYPRLTDIASQGGVFVSPLLTPVITSFTAKQNGEGGILSLGGGDDEDQEDQDESSSSDSDEEDGSHIPKDRRAGAKQRKKPGLFASL